MRLYGKLKLNVLQAKSSHQMKMVWSYQIKDLLFSHIQKYSCTLERKCVKSCRSLQHCNGVTKFTR